MAAKLAAQGRQCPRGHVAHRGEVPGVGRVVDGECAARDSGGGPRWPPLTLSELPDTAPVDDSVAPATVPVAVSAAQEMAPEASTPVVNTSVQFTSLHSSWSQPTSPCAVSPSSVAEPVRASSGRHGASGGRKDSMRPRPAKYSKPKTLRAGVRLQHRENPKLSFGQLRS